VGAGRRYTLAEATALIGPLGALIEELRAARAVIGDRELVARLAAKGTGNGGGADGTRFAEAALRFGRGLAQLDRWGVVVRDLDSGLCDFPARRAGRDVFLCWQVGEPEIGWWHEPDAGFRGRRPLDEEIP
jgi:hypothetical protein